MANDDSISPVGEDPYTDDGHLNELFANEVGDDIADLLADPGSPDDSEESDPTWGCLCRDPALGSKWHSSG